MRTLFGVSALLLAIVILGSASSIQAQNAADKKSSPSASELATIDHLLTTTRSVRKRLDLTKPVEPEVIEKAIDIALQAPDRIKQSELAFRCCHRSRKEESYC